jgi:hypothetical protein
MDLRSLRVDEVMSDTEFVAMCAAFFAQYEPLIKILSGALAAMGIVAGVVIGLFKAFRSYFPVTP